MSRILLNFTNHPLPTWTAEQLKAAEQYGKIVDYKFPLVDPSADEQKIMEMAERYVAEFITAYGPAGNLTVHISGDPTFCFACVSLLKSAGVCCIASCTYRDSIVLPDGTKISKYKFIRFRKY